MNSATKEFDPITAVPTLTLTLLTVLPSP